MVLTGFVPNLKHRKSGSNWKPPKGGFLLAKEHLMNHLPILIGSAISGGYNPNLGEPYRVIWNPQVIVGNEADYITVNPQADWGASVKNTAVLTDYDPPAIEPVMLTKAVSPISVQPGYPIFSYETAYEFADMYQIRNIKQIADTDRRGKLPKVFQFRFRTLFANARVTGCNLLSYDMKNGKHVAVHLTHNTSNEVHARISLWPDGSSHFVSDQVLIDVPRDGSFTDVFRFIIFSDRVSIYMGEPGTEIVRILNDTPLIAADDSVLSLFQMTDDKVDTTNYDIDGLYIYDGYF